MKKHCCEELAASLGKGNVYPKPAYISPEDWERSGHLEWWYPGADGPGYYMIHVVGGTEELPTPIGLVSAPKIEYRRMVECPYCGDKKESNDDEVDLGPCCACEGTENVRNIICLDRKGPTPGKGWGCFVCGLPLDGAVAVLCDDCLEREAEIRFVCIGYPASDGRMPIEELPDEPFEHDLAYHPERPFGYRPSVEGSEPMI